MQLFYNVHNWVIIQLQKLVSFLLIFNCRFKNNGENFHVKLPTRKVVQNVSVPEDLVQIQAYLRWERKGKQMYTPEQDKASKNYNFL